MLSVFNCKFQLVRIKRNENSQVYQIILNRSKVLKEEKQYWKLFFFQSRLDYFQYINKYYKLLQKKENKIN